MSEFDVVEACARAAYEVNRAYCLALREMAKALSAR